MEIVAIEPFLEYWDGIRARTVRVARAIPPERIEWSHAPGKWTFGDLLRHLGGTERWMFVENAFQRPSRYPGHGRELAEGYDGVLAYLTRMHDESMTMLRALTPAQLAAKTTNPAGGAISVWKWLRAMVEHEAHHRGQIHLMLSMIGGSAPPLFGLTEEEVRARSMP